MDSEMKAHSVMESLRLGSPHDIYYYTHATTKKQSIPTIVDNRFYQALNNLRQGSSTFIISVDQGLSDVILGVKLPAQGGDIDYTGLALPRGWLYSLISKLTVRYGSSSQMFFTGAQVNIANLREMPNPTTRDQLFELGGANLKSLADFSGDNLFAYAYLNLPHNSPNGSLSKPNPFPTELIGQPVVITLEMNFLPNLFSSVAPNGSLAGAPQALDDAYFQIKQVHAKDAGELMSMPSGKGSAYSFPCKAFYQNEIEVQLSGQTTYQPLLTGFRNGEVRSIIMWVTKDSDTRGVIDASGRFTKNFTNYILPKDIQVLYNGTVFFRADDIASQMWNLVSTETPSQLQCTVLSQVDGVYTVTQKAANWVEVPFGQVFEQLSGSHMYVAGKQIQNAVVNLMLTMPDTDSYTLHAVYSYNCNIMIADRGAEFFFG